MSILITIPTNLSDDDSIPFQCDISYDPSIELVKYLLQVSYLFVNVILNIMILRFSVFTDNSGFRENSFFTIYAADLIVGIYMCLSEILIGRLFIYITPLCSILSPYFFNSSIFLKIYFTSIHYSQGFKTISQVFLSFNRMTSVLFPVSYNKTWKRILIPNMAVLFVLPVGIIWNIMISRVYANPSSGGFSVNYIKKVTWASLSKFHLAYFIFSLALIIIFSGITLYALLILKKRLKSAETSITIATMVISIEFAFLAIIQIYFAFFSSTTSFLRPYLLRVLDFTYDFLNLSTTIIFICFNRQLRVKFLRLRNGHTNSVVTRGTTNITVLSSTLPVSIWTIPSSS